MVVDTLVIYLAARDELLFWLDPLLATAGSLTGAAITFWIGHRAGEVGLERLIPAPRLERFRSQVRNSGAVAMALPALLPPPFPLTLLTLTCGALGVNRWLFFTAFALMRLIRFGAEAVLARIYGPGILHVLESNAVQIVVVAFIAVAVLGTIVSAILLWRQTHCRAATAA